MLNKISQLNQLIQERIIQPELDVPVDLASINLAKHLLKIEKELKNIDSNYSINIQPIVFKAELAQEPIVAINNLFERLKNSQPEETQPALFISLEYNQKELKHWTTGLHFVKYQGLDYQEYERNLDQYLSRDYPIEEQVVFSEDNKLYTSILEHLIIDAVLTNEKTLKQKYSFVNEMKRNTQNTLRNKEFR